MAAEGGSSALVTILFPITDPLRKAVSSPSPQVGRLREIGKRGRKGGEKSNWKSGKQEAPGTITQTPAHLFPNFPLSPSEEKKTKKGNIYRNRDNLGALLGEKNVEGPNENPHLSRVSFPSGERLRPLISEEPRLQESIINQFLKHPMGHRSEFRATRSLSR